MIFPGMTDAPSAKVADGRLILSLPDAETPALWMMDLGDAATAVLRLENDRQGLYVLKKHGGKGAAETVAVYRDRTRAANALKIAGRALEKARSTGGHVRAPSRLGRFVTWFLAIWFVLYILSLDGLVLRIIFSPFLGGGQMTAGPAIPGNVAQQGQVPPNTPGVPVSADDFLQHSQGLLH